MKILNILLAISLTISMTSSLSFAQSPKLYFIQKGFFPRMEVTDGKMSTGPEFMGHYDLENVLKDNPKALAYYKQYDHYHNYAMIVFWSTFAAGFAGMLISQTSTSGCGSICSPGLFWGGFAVLLGGVFWFSHEQAMANRNFFNAINTYNGVDVKDDDSQDTKLHFQPTIAVGKDGGGLGLNLAF